MKLASFDLEIAKAVEGDDWRRNAVGDQLRDGDDQQPAYDRPRRQSVAADLEGRSAVVDGRRGRYGPQAVNGWPRGITPIVTVNGAGFDFAVLARSRGMVAECADLMLNHHCDMMMMSVCNWGWRVGRSPLAHGAGVQASYTMSA